MNELTVDLAKQFPEERLLVLLNLAVPSDSAVSEIRNLTARTLNWESFFDLMELNAVVPLTMKRIRELEIEIPFSERLKGAVDKGLTLRKQSEKRIEEMNRFLSEMNKEGIKVILLKGSLLGHTIYQDPAYKKMNDVDILVRFDQAKATASILRKLGFSSVGALFGNEEISDKNHHAPPFVSQDLSCVVGLHWGLHSRFAPWKSDIDGIWQRCTRISVGGLTAYRMSWEDNLLHLCFHLPFYKIGLRELADVFNLILAGEPSIDWKVLKTRAIEWKVLDPVYRVLSLANAMLQYSIPRILLYEFEKKATRVCRRDTQKRLIVPHLLLQSRSVHIAKIEKAFSVFVLSRNSEERIRAWAMTWVLTLWPKTAEVYKLNCHAPVSQEDHLSKVDWAIARARTPSLIWRAMARDYGHLGLSVITSMNILKVIQLIVAYPFVRPASSLLDHPARKLLEVLE